MKNQGQHEGQGTFLHSPDTIVSTGPFLFPVAFNLFQVSEVLFGNSSELKIP